MRTFGSRATPGRRPPVGADYMSASLARAAIRCISHSGGADSRLTMATGNSTPPVVEAAPCATAGGVHFMEATWNHSSSWHSPRHR